MKDIKELEKKYEELGKEIVMLRCEYCTKEKGICNNRAELGIEMHIGRPMLLAYGLDKQGQDISVKCPIHYCPMCGRKLEV